MTMLQPGLTASVNHTVAEPDTAIALGSGEVPVLGTPRLISLCEAATVTAVSTHLAKGQTTVGIRVEIDHLAATPVGAGVAVTATLDRLEGNLLFFSVVASAGGRKVAEGAIHRSIVDRKRFLDRL